MKTIIGDGKTTHLFLGSHGRCYCGVVAIYATYTHSQVTCKTCKKALKAEQKRERVKAKHKTRIAKKVEYCSCGFPQSHPLPHEHDRTKREKAIISHYRGKIQRLRQGNI